MLLLFNFGYEEPQGYPILSCLGTCIATELSNSLKKEFKFSNQFPIAKLSGQNPRSDGSVIVLEMRNGFPTIILLAQ